MFQRYRFSNIDILYFVWQLLVQKYADSDELDHQGDKNLAQKLLDILYATEDGFAVPDGDNQEF